MNHSAQLSSNRTFPPRCALGLCFDLERHLVDIICSAVVFLFSIFGNSIMFFVLMRNLRKNSRVNRVYLLLLHLNVANIIVTLISLPMDIVHKSTVQWYGPQWSCKLMKSFNVFGLYLASYVLICMSVDRVFAIVRPLYSLKSLKQVKITLVIAWIMAAICSLPQAFLWQLASHPYYTDFRQCLSPEGNSLTVANTIINFVGCYCLPVTFIIVCYAIILVKIVQDERQSTSLSSHMDDPDNIGSKRQGSLRRSSHKHLRRAKIRTLQMTFAVVVAFLVCWTPYFVMVLIFFLNPKNKSGIPVWATRLLYGFAMSNTAVNPYLYGYFSFNVRQELSNLFHSPTGSSVYRREVSVMDQHTRNGQESSAQHRKTVTINSADEVRIIYTPETTGPPGDLHTEDSVLI